MHGDGVAHAVVVLDDGHPVPFVEGGAGMRDAEADTVADLGGLRFLAGVPAQVGVLIVERRDLPAGGYGLRFERATRRARDGHGHRKVERDVALAHGEDRQAWLGARLHLAHTSIAGRRPSPHWQPRRSSTALTMRW